MVNGRADTRGRGDLQFERIRGRGGFVEFMLDVIQPRDEAQRGQIVPVLEETARRNREIVEGTRRDLAVEIDSLKVRLAPVLDAAGVAG